MSRVIHDSDGHLFLHPPSKIIATASELAMIKCFVTAVRLPECNQ